MRDEKGKTALHRAALGGSEEVVALLLSHGAQANSLMPDRKTPLHLACLRGHLGVVQQLLQHMEGQGLAAQDDKGCRGLHHAAGQRHEEVVALGMSRTCVVPPYREV